jgi:Domain of unknown function (DUF3846)
MDPKRTVRVLHVPTGGPATVRDVADDLDAYKGLLDDAWLEQISIPGPGWGGQKGPRTYVMLLDEEGKLKALPRNRLVPRFTIGGLVPEVIAGPFFVCRDGGEDFASLTRADVAFLAEVLALGDVAWPPEP